MLALLKYLARIGIGTGICIHSLYAADLIVEVGGIESASGKVVVSLYATRESFLTKPAATVSATAVKSGITVTFQNLEPGEYAISAYHDENSNGQLDSNMLGIPKEPTGASNNARNSFGPPKFEQAKIVLGSSGMKASFSLQR
jgi:uncharacterized protein (DUF2141 family)